MEHTDNISAAYLRAILRPLRFIFIMKMACRPYVCVLIPCLLLACCAAQQETQSSWQTSANEFVQQTLTRAGSPAAITLSFENLSSLGPAEQETLKPLILNSFRAAGVRLVKAELALAEVQITFSEDWQGYVWVAKIIQGPGTQVVIKKVSRPARTTASALPALTLRRNMVWQQDEPILDFTADGQNLLVLEPEQVSVYTNDSGRWRLRQVMEIQHAQPWQRDLRGRLLVEGSQVTAFLPGTKCTGAKLGALQCAPADDPWQIDAVSLGAFYSPARNFFTGVLAGQNAGDSVLPFFSGAAWMTAETRVWIFTGTDSRARLYLNNLASPAATFNDWGSNITTLRSGCGSGTQVLVSSPGDLTQPDAVQALEISGREAVPASATVGFSGPVVALWPGQNGQSANAVVKSLTTGKYEAISLTVTCNQ